MTITRQRITYNVHARQLPLNLEQKHPQFNKKVLHERKRHTARRIASARCAALSPDGWGGGHPVLTYDLTWQGGTPPPQVWQTDTCENRSFPRTSYAGGNKKHNTNISYGILCNVASPLSVTCRQRLTSSIINVILISFSLSKHQSSKCGHSLTFRYLMWPKSSVMKRRHLY